MRDPTLAAAVARPAPVEAPGAQGREHIMKMSAAQREGFENLDTAEGVEREITAVSDEIDGSARRARPAGYVLLGVVRLEEDALGNDCVDRLVRAFDHQLRAELAVLDRDHRVADVLLQPR